jgi:predicted RNA-binding Zn ribbon-like protein
MSHVLQGFDAAAVHALWQKALERRHADPEAAIAGARSLLEAVCRHVLAESGITSSAPLDLPALMKMTAEQLDVAPSHPVQAAFKRLFADTASAVDGLSARTKPSARHAQLAVNVAGATALFIVESWELRVEEEFLDMLDDSKGG